MCGGGEIMNIDINKIVPADDLNIDTELVLKKLAEIDEIIVFKNNQPQFIIVGLDSYTDRPSFKKPVEISNSNVEKEKIGRYVRESLMKLFLDQLIPKEEIGRLADTIYSKSVFNMNYPVLKEYNPSMSIDEQKGDVNGYNRYYTTPLFAYNKQYLLCSQWYEHLHRKAFENWLSQWQN